MTKKTEELIEKAANPPPAPIRRGPVSRLRKEITKVNTLTTPAVENLRKHLKGEKVDKDLVASSKWALETLISFYNAAAREEQVRVARSSAREASKKANRKKETSPAPKSTRSSAPEKGTEVATARLSLTR